MKWILSVFISLFLLNHVKLSASASSFSEGFGNQRFNFYFGAEKGKENGFNIPSEFKHCASNSSSDNQYPKKRKKKNKKGVKPVYCYLPADCVLFSVVSNTDTIFSKKEFDTSRSFFGNGKRGPPYLLV